jgi:hypothetical protein
LLDFEAALNRVHVPAVYAPQVAVAARQVRATFPRIYSEPTLPVERSGPTTTQANPRDVNRALREAITTSRTGNRAG